MFLPERTLFCKACDARVQPLITIQVPVTASRSVKVFAASAYQEPVQTLIIAKRWKDHVASCQLAQLIWERTDIRNQKIDFFVPVPLHWTRMVGRGYNQSEEIAHVLARLSGKKVAHVAKRIKRTIFQAGLNPEQRYANVSGAFVFAETDLARYRDKHLVIVDDLLTTGATVRALAKLLYDLKPASVCVVVASRVTLS
jgi:ComF family protein